MNRPVSSNLKNIALEYAKSRSNAKSALDSSQSQLKAKDKSQISEEGLTCDHNTTPSNPLRPHIGHLDNETLNQEINLQHNKQTMQKLHEMQSISVDSQTKREEEERRKELIK